MYMSSFMSVLLRIRTAEEEGKQEIINMSDGSDNDDDSPVSEAPVVRRSQSTPACELVLLVVFAMF